MKFNNRFRIVAEPYITEAYCNCGQELKTVSNGLLASALFCPKCEAVYQLKLIRVPKKQISDEYLEQCRREA